MRRCVGIALVVVLAVGSGGAVASAMTGASTLTDQAAAEDVTLLASAPTTSGETSSTTPPASILKQAPSEPAYDDLVVQALYWTANQSASKVYAALTASTPAGFDVGGSGDVYGPKLSDDLSYIEYDPTTVPSDIAFGELLVAVAPVSAKKSAVGVFAEAVARPPRPAAEDLPAIVDQVQATVVVGIDAERPLRRTVTSAQASALVTTFNALKVEPPGEGGCGLDLGQSQAAVFYAQDHVWTASIGACAGVSVTEDGTSLPALEVTTKFYNALRNAVGISKPWRPKTTLVPSTTQSLHVSRVTEPSGARDRTLTVSKGRAGSLLSSVNGMPKVATRTFHCQHGAGKHTLATFRALGHRWRLNEAPCHTIEITRDGHHFVSLVANDEWEQQIHNLFNRTRAPALAGASRPRTEHVPHSVDHASLTYRKGPVDSNPQHVTVHGKRARRLVAIFDRLALEPSGSVHCDIAGGPQTTVTFRTRAHTWTATTSACTDLQVTRDGTRLPTLVPSASWTKATAADLPH